VSRVLNFVPGRTVAIRDAFKLGKYSTSKTRPVLVTLCGVWDKRLVLSVTRPGNLVSPKCMCLNE